MDRRKVIKNSALGLLGLSVSSLVSANTGKTNGILNSEISSEVPKYWPNIDPEVVGTVVGKSHSDLEAVKNLVEKRPELARAVWEWRFGDFESAIGAASHVGRRDIALYLMSKGARPSIFTFAMLGNYEVVKSIIELHSGIQKTLGPHGISLLNHAYAGERMKGDMTQKQNDNLRRTIDYLEGLGDADGEKYEKMPEEAQKKYVGDYKYGDGEKDGFTVAVNMQKRLSLARIGGFGGSIYYLGNGSFMYNGAPSVKVRFNLKDNVVTSLLVNDPELEVTAIKVS